MIRLERILHCLENYGTVISLEAIREYGVMRLAYRITGPKKEGLAIRRETVSGRKRFGRAAGCAWYRIRADGETQP